ncbi:hypothetical protein THAOC_06925 [Thalassiosira oceanica]|uniref:Uncharacterized protein n=1 Tax=Thalassiosira oceanica TaxID=159749 RepID=K0TL78_THAOC|nr:hypothetical protein THAOC_06925 [Thalassiosira oceanica]|eukprot:EJK71612.1 hypothetical protein THAOC_06925 [Thalassiosira oceanica]
MAARDHRPVRASTLRGGGLTLTGVGVAEAAEAVDGHADMHPRPSHRWKPRPDDDPPPPVQASLDESKRRRDVPILWPESLESARQEDNGGAVDGDSDSEGNDEAIEVLSRPTGHSSPTRSQYEKRVSENEAGNDLQELVNVVTELADKENEVVPGMDTLGGLDEQNIESTHPEFNELIRRFGTTRGARLKALVFQEHLFNRADFQNDVVEAMLSDTSRTKRPDTKPREEREDGMEAIKQTVNNEDLEMRQLENAMRDPSVDTGGRYRVRHVN